MAECVTIIIDEPTGLTVTGMSAELGDFAGDNVKYYITLEGSGSADVKITETRVEGGSIYTYYVAVPGPGRYSTTRKLGIGTFNVCAEI